jgi:hypothetical protein
MIMGIITKPFVLQYGNDPISWFQKKIRGDMVVLTDHISKEMNELNLIRCKNIPKRPGADWRDLPDEKVQTHLIDTLQCEVDINLMHDESRDQ